VVIIESPIFFLFFDHPSYLKLKKVCNPRNKKVVAQVFLQDIHVQIYTNSFLLYEYNTG